MELQIRVVISPAVVAAMLLLTRLMQVWISHFTRY